MSVTEIKAAIDRMTREERDEIAAHLRRRREELARIHEEMDAGKKFSLEDLRRVHEELKAQGK